MFANTVTHSTGSLIRRLPVYLFFLTLLATGAIAFAGGQPAPPSGSPEIPSIWVDSKEELIRRVLACLEKNDISGLSSLTVSESDYRTIVWPELPISNPRNNIPFEFVFGRHNQLSRGGMGMKLRDFNGRQLELLRFEVRPERDKYENIHIYPVGDVVVRDTDGKTYDIRVLGSILEHHGKFKAFSYKTD